MYRRDASATLRSDEIKVSRFASATRIKGIKRNGHGGRKGDKREGAKGEGGITARRSDTRRMRGIFSPRGHAHPSFYAAFTIEFSTLRGLLGSVCFFAAVSTESFEAC